MDHIITADDSEEITIHSKWLDWTWTLGQLFQQSENEVVTAAIAKLRTKISGKFDAEVLLHELETMTKEAKELDTYPSMDCEPKVKKGLADCRLRLEAARYEAEKVVSTQLQTGYNGSQRVTTG